MSSGVFHSYKVHRILYLLPITYYLLPPINSLLPVPCSLWYIIKKITFNSKAMETQDLKTLIKESIREVLREERLLLCHMLMPYVSDQDQQELDTSFGLPQDYETEEVTDLTDGIKNDY
ncbi:hypothetical protein [Moorena sp. SIO4E2]|uniref:hypothetical protein n=1 Tax=Moorena sp. SIO4E2 TaxID=2607826 RepID=UPI00257CFA8D|nr:hypothetical protein [Moorena sp. SIO4E2]